MTIIETFRLELKQQPPVYYGGQLLEGNLIIKTTEATSIQSISLRLVGQCVVHWTEMRRRRRGYAGVGRVRAGVHGGHGIGGGGHAQIDFNAQECYFDVVVPFFGTTGGHVLEELPAGERIFPFQFSIPVLCPSSFEGPYGYVRYTAHAAICRPGWEFNTNTMLGFTVLRHYDLNYFPHYRAPVTGEVTGATSGFFVRKGKITVHLQINKQGYVPGEDIIVWAKIENNTKYELEWSRVFLQQDTFFTGVTQSYHYAGEVKAQNNLFIISEVKKGPIAAGETYTWDHVRLRVPPCPASALPGCEIIDIQYRIEFSVHNPHGAKVVRAFPLTIGTVPLYEAAPVQPPQPALASAPPPTAPQAYAGSPPAYAECVGGKVDINKDQESAHETIGNTQYAPIYPTYDFSRQAPQAQ